MMVRHARRGLRHAAAMAVLAASAWAGVAHAAVLEEVLVTATRRTTTDIQTTPVSVSAFGDRALDALIMHDITDIAAAVPNLIGGNVAGFNAASFGMRGIGQTSIIIYQEAPVGVTIDDFVVPHIQSQALEAFDIESVEVLRGPQGTLFGKNTTAGAVNVRTKRPVLNETSVEGRLMYGEDDRLETRFAANYGSDTWAVRAAGLYQRSDGYYRAGKSSTDVLGNAFPGDGGDLGGDDVFSGRFKLMWQPNERFNALFQYEIIRDNQDSPPVVNETDPGVGLATLGFTGVTGDEPYERAAITNRDDGLDMDGGHQIDVDGFYLNLRWDVTEHLTLHSLTGYREQESLLPSTYTGEAAPAMPGLPLPPTSLFDANRVDERETFQQEIRVASDFAGPFNFVAGGFYQKNDADFCVLQFLGFLDYFAAFGAPTDPNSTLTLVGLPNLTINNQDDNPSILCNQMKTDAFAVFGDADFALSDTITIGGGVRWSYEKKKWAGRPQTYLQYLNGIAAFDPTFGVDDLGELIDAADFQRFPFNVFRDDKSWTEPSYRLTASYRPNDDMFFWSTIARSFKSGTYNDQTGTSLFFVPGAPIPARALAPVDPEIAFSFEIGAKMDLLDDRLRVNGVVFTVSYDDAQRELVTIQGAFQETRFFNAAEVEAKGVELEATMIVTPRLTVQGNVSWQEVEYQNFIVDTDFDGVPDIDLTNTEVPRSPEWTAYGAATYTHPLQDWGSLSHRFSVSYEDENIHVAAAPGASLSDGLIEEKVIVDWSTTFNDATERYFVRVFGKNLTDEEYRTGILPVGDLWTMTSYGAPRWFGAEVGAKFDF